jgi:hypothetical protein
LDDESRNTVRYRRKKAAKTSATPHGLNRKVPLVFILTNITIENRKTPSKTRNTLNKKKIRLLTDFSEIKSNRQYKCSQNRSVLDINGELFFQQSGAWKKNIESGSTLLAVAQGFFVRFGQSFHE